jgi:Na+-driven multidrug efflux pump
MIPLGLSTGLGCSLGNLLGAARVGEAKKLAASGLCAGQVIIVLYVAGMWAAGGQLAGLFTAEADVLLETARAWPWFCAHSLVSGSFALVSGINRGLGLQRQNALCVLLLLWPLGVPLVLLGARDAADVWRLLLMTYVALTVAMGLFTVCSSWTKLSEVIIMQQQQSQSQDQSKAAAGAVVVQSSDESSVASL